MKKKRAPTAAVRPQGAARKQRDEALRRIATVIRDYAKTHELALEDLAGPLGVSRDTVYHIAGPKPVSGKGARSRTMPKGDVLMAISMMTDVTSDWLLAFDGSTKDRKQTRTRAELDADLGRQMAREVAAALRHTPDANRLFKPLPTADDLRVDAKAALASLVKRETAAFIEREAFGRGKVPLNVPMIVDRRRVPGRGTPPWEK